MNKEELKAKILAVVARRRKQVEGKPNIEGVSKPKKLAPKKVKENKKKPHQPGQVSIGAHGGRYVQEPSGHKRYISEGKLSGTKRFKKSEDVVKSVLEEIVREEQAREFVNNFRKEKPSGK